MNKVQVIFLSDSYKNLEHRQKEKLIEIVKSNFSDIFDVNSDQVDVSLINGISNDNQNDIVLGIEREHIIANEADYRTRFASSVSQDCERTGILQGINYKGMIGWQDGILKSNAKNQDKETVKQNASNKTDDASLDYEKRALMYKAVEPEYTFESLCISDKTKNDIFNALSRIEYEREVFDVWGLRVIMPNPVCALSFFGPAGTGKSLAADAIASYLEKKIIRTSYADIENKYVGEGPKNVCAVFLAAEKQDAVLLIDEADSLLSKRLVNVQDPSGQALNSMRSQLLISLEHFHGVVIFTTNLVTNYDAAFISRLINVNFDLPDKDMRVEIWKKHILPRSNGKYTLSIPLSDDIDFDCLAESYKLSGRDIRNATVDACLMAYRSPDKKLNMECLMTAAKGIIEKSEKALKALDHTKVQLTDGEKKLLAEKMQESIDKKKENETE